MPVINLLWTEKGQRFLLSNFGQFQTGDPELLKEKILKLALDGWRMDYEYRGNNEYLYANKYYDRKKYRIYLGKDLSFTDEQ